MLSKEAEIQQTYEYFLTNHLPEGFTFYGYEGDFPTVKVTVKEALETAKVVEAELRLNSYSNDMVEVEPYEEDEFPVIRFIFDLLFFTEEQTKACLLLIARTIYTFENASTNKEKSFFFPFFKSKKKETKAVDDKFKDEITKEDVIKAVRKFSDNLPQGTYRTILVNDDYSIDFSQLRRYLPRTPTQKFYLSKETYDIFEEHEKHIPPLMDKVQKAVDQYVKEHNEYPTLPYDHLRRVNTFLLVQEHLLEEVPNIEFYITNYDGLITHVKTKEK
ncbi:DUF3939 domain-containing protein [Bacillus sp. 1NLA3E]|uniref:DUF3939 domain-containing protein n=1 Tax=Bacillus sp. 1NLA3E TaxID=666686 RepID=UPI000247E4B5|nr:DUF3939 domain-containing protein [Bacillus sp. 1NLA3E]AGK53235.1 hypothetical protein B1NLA3E_07365 [Bacillus sp. 1NLA3E]